MTPTEYKTEPKMNEILLYISAGAAFGLPVGYFLAGLRRKLSRRAVPAPYGLPHRLILENTGLERRRAGTADSALPPSYWRTAGKWNANETGGETK